MRLLLRAIWYVATAMLICAGVLCLAFTIHMLIVMGVFDGPLRNPYKADNICFTADWPGATSRFVEYSFVTCNEPRTRLAEPVGFDQAVLSFEDVDDDGKDEAVIESSWYKCRFGQLGCFSAHRVVLKICPGCNRKVTVVSEKRLPELERD